jgi:hypothetical protein
MAIYNYTLGFPQSGADRIMKSAIISTQQKFKSASIVHSSMSFNHNRQHILNYAAFMAQPKIKTATTDSSLEILVSRGNIALTVISSSTSFPTRTNMVIASNSLIENEIDAEIQAMTMDEIISAIEAQFGAWADREDIGDDWVERLRSESDDRLSDIYNPTQE